MRNVIIGLAATAGFAATFATTQVVAAPGHCHPGVSNTSDWDCVEWTSDGGTNYDHTTLGLSGTSPGGFFGSDGTSGSVFTFTGPTELSCPGLPVIDCDLTLDGQVRINTEAGDDFGLKIVGGDVSSDNPFSLCSTIEISNFPWYGHDNPHEGPWNASEYSINPGTLGVTSGVPSGSKALSIGNIALSAAGIGITTDGHVHDVTFANNGHNGSTFTFTNSEIFDTDPNYVSHTGTGCTITGTLAPEDPDVDVNAY